MSALFYDRAWLCSRSLVVLWMKGSIRQKVSMINNASKVFSHGNWYVCSSEQRVLCRWLTLTLHNSSLTSQATFHSYNDTLIFVQGLFFLKKDALHTLPHFSKIDQTISFRLDLHFWNSDLREYFNFFFFFSTHSHAQQLPWQINMAPFPHGHGYFPFYF